MSKKSPTPRKKADPAKARTKAEQIVALLRRPSGASINEIMKATGWHAHSVRDFISNALRKKKGLLVTTRSDDGNRRRYVISGVV